jgi:hypothetical protein
MTMARHATTGILRSPAYAETAKTLRTLRQMLARPDHGPLGICRPDKRTWTGPVVRLADLSAEERAALGDATLRPELPRNETWSCRGCRNWTTAGAYRTGRCNWCQHPRGTA